MYNDVNNEMNNDKYVPEYNPKKFNTLALIVTILYYLLIGLLIVGIIAVCIYAFFFDGFLVTVRDVQKFDVGMFIIFLSWPICFFGLGAFFVNIFRKHLGGAIAIYSEPDEEKRSQMHEQYQDMVSNAKEIVKRN